MPVINITKTLRQKLGDQRADDLVDLLNRATEDAREDTLALAEEKYERRLGEEMAMMNQNITEARTELDQHITETKTELDQRITETKTELDQRITEVESRL